MRRAFDDSKDRTEEVATIRTNYRCKANGCPNAGCMDGDVCYWHWRETDYLMWGSITARIRADFERMRNYGPPVPTTPQRKAALLKHMQGA